MDLTLDDLKKAIGIANERIELLYSKCLTCKIYPSNTYFSTANSIRCPKCGNLIDEFCFYIFDIISVTVVANLMKDKKYEITHYVSFKEGIIKSGRNA